MKPLPLGKTHGVTILKVVRPGNYRTLTYRVRVPCCGAEIEITHDGLNQRVAKGTKKCKACQVKINKVRKPQKKKPKKRSFKIDDDYGVVLPTWPKPPSIEGRGVPR